MFRYSTSNLNLPVEKAKVLKANAKCVKVMMFKTIHYLLLCPTLITEKMKSIPHYHFNNLNIEKLKKLLEYKNFRKKINKN